MHRLLACRRSRSQSHYASVWSAWHDACFLAGKGIAWEAASTGCVAPTLSASTADMGSTSLQTCSTASHARCVSPTELTSEEEEDDQVEASTSALRRSNRTSVPNRNRLLRSLTVVLAEAQSDTEAGRRKRRRISTTTPRPRTSVSPAPHLRAARTPRRIGTATAVSEQHKMLAQMQTQTTSMAPSSSPSMPSSSNSGILTTDATSLFSSPVRPSSSPFAASGSVVSGGGGGTTISQRLQQLEELVLAQSKQIAQLQAQRCHNDRQVLNAIAEVHAAHEAERQRRKTHETLTEQRAVERSAQVLTAMTKVESQQTHLKTEIELHIGIC